MELAFGNPMVHAQRFSDRFWGMFLAFSVHTALFIGGSLGRTHKAEFGMSFSDGAAEVDLVAAPAPAAFAAADPAVAASEAPRENPPAPDPEDVPQTAKTLPAPIPLAANPTTTPILRTKNLTGPLGDGSSPIAGADATTLHRVGSSGSYFRPGYYRNPPPPYPAEARKLKQAGRVLLEVQVTAEGKVSSLTIKQGTGFPLLDQAALLAVQNWRFRPATVGGLRMASRVEIPIRFELK